MSGMENPKLYKGIEYVQLDELPDEQKAQIKESFNEELFIKIIVNGKLHQDCILYKDYTCWFESIYKANLNVDSSQAVSDNRSVTVRYTDSNG